MAPDPQVRAAHIRSAAGASGLFLLQRLGVAGVPLTQILGRAAAVLLVLTVGLSALGAAAALPEPLQNAVATVAGYIGIDIPTGEKASESGLLPLLDQDSTPIDQRPTRSGDEDEAGETGGASVTCEDDADDLRYESDEEELADHGCVGDEADDEKTEGDDDAKNDDDDDDDDDDAKDDDDDDAKNDDDDDDAKNDDDDDEGHDD